MYRCRASNSELTHTSVLNVTQLFVLKMYSSDILYAILTILSDDPFTTVAERSKALDLSSSLVRDVGSNPTGSIFFL